MHPSSPSSFSSPSGGGEEKDFLPAGVYLQQDQTQQYLVQGRLMDDTIAPRPQRSLFSRVANAAAGAVIPASSSSSPSSSSTSLPSQPMGSSAPSYHVHQLPSRDLSSSSEDPHSPFSSSSLCQKARIPPTHSSASLSRSSSHLGERGSYLSSSGHMPVGSSTSSSERLSPSSGFSGVHTPNHPPPSLGSGGGGGARVLPRSVEKVIESGEVKIEDINPEQAADISKALLLHQHQNHLLLHEKQQQIQKACQLQRKPLRYHPLSSPSSSSSFTQEEERRSRRGKDGIGGGSSPISAKKESSIKDLREDEERREEGEQEERRRYLGDKNDARTTSLGVDHRRLQMPQPPAFTLSPEELEKSEEKGTRTLNIIREVFYEGIHSHHPSRFPSSCASSLRSSSSSSTTRGRGAGGGEEEQYKKPPGSSSSVRGRRRDISAKGDFSSSEEESISRRENDAARYLEGVRQREEEERERKMRDEEEEEEERKKKMTPQLLSSQRPSTQEARKLRVPSNSSSSSPPPPCRIILEGGQEGYQQRGEGIDRKENEDEEGETSSSPLEEEEESQILEEIEARLKEDAEDFLHEAKIALEESRLTAEREVLALQYIPFKPDRLLHLSNSARESLLGVFVCLCLQHIEG